MGAFKITALVLTPNNYLKYSHEELTAKLPGHISCIPVSYDPDYWRPPNAWYKEHGFPIPKERRPKPGRPAGSAERTSRLEIRCQPELLQLLDQLANNSWYFTGWTRADILHELVKKAAMSAFPDADENINQLVQEIKGIPKPKNN